MFPLFIPFPLFSSAVLMRFPWVVLLFIAIIATEVAVLVPVILTQRASDASAARKSLDDISDRFVERVNEALGELTYNVARTAAVATTKGNRFVSQADLRASLQLDLDPSLSSQQTYIWTPRVFDSQRAAYESFYGHDITEYVNGSFVSRRRRPVYYPYTLFEPVSSTFYNITGFDFLANPRSASYLQNKTLHLVPHSAINRTSPNSYGIVVVAREVNGKGYALGLTSAEDLMNSALTVERSDVVLAAYDASVDPSLQLLFLDTSPTLNNAQTITAFNALPGRNQFFVRTISVLGDDLWLCMLYSNKLASSFYGTQWIVLVAVLVPVCIVIDALYWIVVLLIQQRVTAHYQEIRKRETTQMMLGYVNHEIRNPLQTILGLGDLCVEDLEGGGEENERLISNIQSIIRAAEFIEHIASDVLDIRRIEEGKIQLDITELDVRQFTSDLEKSVLQLAKPGIEFKIICDPEITTLRTDRYRLEQVLMNFLTNAFKHTESGSVVVSFSLLSSGHVMISVSDTGKGIPDSVKESLFGQFSQVSARDATELGGFGLGLYLTRILAQLLGGTVGFESTVGKGSTFWIKVPYEKDWRTLGAQFEDSSVGILRGKNPRK